MSGPTLVVFASVLALIFLLVVTLLVWQEARSAGREEAVTYVIDDAVTFIVERIPEDASARLGRADVQRILEWELYYLQGLAQDDRRTPVETVAGDHGPAMEWIGREIAAKNKVAYDSEDIAIVLRLEADYLVTIGAIGDAVETEERDA